MTWRCLKCRRERPDNEWTQWACREGGTCVSGLAPAPSDPWDAFRPIALPTIKYRRPLPFADRTCQGFNRSWVEGMADLGDAYEAEEAAFNLDRGGR